MLHCVAQRLRVLGERPRPSLHQLAVLAVPFPPPPAAVLRSHAEEQPLTVFHTTSRRKALDAHRAEALKSKRYAGSYNGPERTGTYGVVHIIGIDPSNPEGLKVYLGDRDLSTLNGTGTVDHMAFAATSQVTIELNIPVEEAQQAA